MAKNSLPDLHEITIGEVNNLIDIALVLQDKAMFHEYAKLLLKMRKENAESVFIETYDGIYPIYSKNNDETQYIHELTRGEVKEMIEVALLLKDEAMFHDYTQIEISMIEKGFDKIYVSSYSSPDTKAHDTPHVKVFINGEHIGNIDSVSPTWERLKESKDWLSFGE